MRIVGIGSASGLAAGVLVAAGVSRLGGPARGLEDAIKEANRAKSVRVETAVEKGGEQTDKWHLLRRGDVVRVEGGREGRVFLMSLSTREGVESNPGAKRAVRRKGDETPVRVVDALLTPLADLKARLAAQDGVMAKPLGTGDGAAYEVTVPTGTPPGATRKVGIDPKTDLPARIETVNVDGRGEALRPEFSDWNAEFDPKLFSLDVPAGFGVIAMTNPGSHQPPAGTESFAVLWAALTKFERVKSVRATVRTAGPKLGPAADRKYFAADEGAKARLESPGDVAVYGPKGFVFLKERAEVARVGGTGGRMTVPGQPGVGSVKRMPTRGEGVEDAGGQQLDGRPVRVFRARGVTSGYGTGDVTYGIDEKQGLPARFEGAYTGGPLGDVTETAAHLGFDEDLDPKLFDRTVPEGYKVGKFKLDTGGKNK